LALLPPVDAGEPPLADPPGEVPAAPIGSFGSSTEQAKPNSANPPARAIDEIFMLLMRGTTGRAPYAFFIASYVPEPITGVVLPAVAAAMRVFKTLLLAVPAVSRKVP
jgi:hypothetical protein